MLNEDREKLQLDENSISFMEKLEKAAEEEVDPLEKKWLYALLDLLVVSLRELK